MAWIRLLRKGQLPPRYQGASAVLGNDALVMGGWLYSIKPLAPLWILSRANTTAPVWTPAIGISMSSAVCLTTTTVGGFVLVFAGEYQYPDGSLYFSNSLVKYTTVGSVRVNYTEPWPAARSLHAAAALGNVL